MHTDDEKCVLIQATAVSNIQNWLAKRKIVGKMLTTTPAQARGARQSFFCNWYISCSTQRRENMSQDEISTVPVIV